MPSYIKKFFFKKADASNLTTARYLQLSAICESLAESKTFQTIVTLVVFLAAIVVGIQTQLAGRHEALFAVTIKLDYFIIGVFSGEALTKICAEGMHPHRYFKDPWNRFDFFIVLSCLIFMIPGLPKISALLSMIRLLRLLRILKLVRLYPEVRQIVEVCRIYFLMRSQRADAANFIRHS
jgi:voltage-gated sodium channel